MGRARACALTAVRPWLAKGMKRKEPTVRQQLRAWYYDTARQRGPKRQALRVATCLAPLLGWVVRGWQGPPLALALEAPTLGQRFVGLAVSVAYRGCALPGAWVIGPAGAQHAWRREWLRVWRLVRPAIPRGWTVIGLADRGWYAPWLLHRLTRLGWHPFLCINRGAAGGQPGRPAGGLCRVLPRGQGRGGAVRASPVHATRWPVPG